MLHVNVTVILLVFWGDAFEKKEYWLVDSDLLS